jgi:hypothetical protein
MTNRQDNPIYSVDSLLTASSEWDYGSTLMSEHKAYGLAANISRDHITAHVRIGSDVYAVFVNGVRVWDRSERNSY